MRIYFAPLEGITGYIYRSAHAKLYKDIDKYFAPFISPADKYTLGSKELRELTPENNSGFYLVPQILTCKSNHFNNAVEELQKLGYNEVNLNLGCPSGTVCAKKKGAGFLPETTMLRSFLEDIYSYGDKRKVDISIKTRLGYFTEDEFYDLLDLFNEYPVSELIIHPRNRNDFYKGEPRLEFYKYALEYAKMPLVYNGNIFSKEDYDDINKTLNHENDVVMLGRGIIANPELASCLKTNDNNIDFNRFWDFHDTIYHEYQKIISPDINVLYKMKELWKYWKLLFEDNERAIKHLMKSKKYAEYENILRELK